MVIEKKIAVYNTQKNTIDKITSLEQEVPTRNLREAKQVARISFTEWGGVRGRPKRCGRERIVIFDVRVLVIAEGWKAR